MKRLATHLSTLSEDNNRVSILAVIVILMNLIVAVVFTGHYSSIPPVNRSTKSANAPLIRTRQVSLHGQGYEILTNAQGLTLYYFYFLGSDIPTTVCTGGCTTTWHPLLTTSTSAITVAKPEPQGKLTAVSNTNGLQVQYNGRFLYTYSGDKMPGQMHGNGLTSMGNGVIAEIAIHSSTSPVNHSTKSANTPLIRTRDGSLHGRGYEILTNAQGLTLYYSESEGAVCTGGCTTTWRPLLTTSTSAITSDLPPKMQSILTAVPGPNGLQVQYIGHFLYTYSGDKVPGQMNGLTNGTGVDTWMFAH